MEEFLLPSEIARLVYGQLKRLKCDDIAEKFLNTSPHMVECAEWKKKNLTFKTEVHGLSLEEILNQFLNMNELLLNNANSKIKSSEQKFKESVSALKFILKLNDANKDTKKDNGPELNAGINLKLNSNEFEASSEVKSKIRSSSKPNVNSKINEHSTELNLCYSESNDPEYDCSSGNNDLCNESIIFSKEVDRAKIKGIKILKPRNSSKFNNSEHSSSKQQAKYEKNSENGCVYENSRLVSSFNDSSNSETSRLTCNKSPEPVIVESQSSVDVNDNTFKDQTKSTLTKEPIIINDQLISNVSEISFTRQLRSSSAKMINKTIDNDSSKASKLEKNQRKSFVSNDDKQLSKSSSPSANTKPPVDLALMQQKLIENSKLHACLATNINKVINESTLPTFSDELDVAIKKVADETVNDPLCDDIMNGLLACVSNDNLLKDNAEEQDIDFPVEINNHEKETPILENLEQSTSFTIDMDDKNSRFEMQEFVRFNDEDSSDIIVVRVPQNEQNVYSEHDYTVGDQNNLMNSDSVTSANLRNYITCSSDIASTSDNEGNIINVYPEQNREDVIQLHSLENNGSYIISQNIPLIIGNHPKIMINEKRTRRSKYQSLTTSVNSRKWTPIAPKPCPEGTQTNNKISENIAVKSNTRLAKRMKK